MSIDSFLEGWSIDHQVAGNYLRDLEKLGNAYNVFTILCNSKPRLIQEPQEPLKTLQRNLLGFFNKYPFHPSCTARTQLSVIDNARPHHGSSLILKTDIKQFFPNTTEQKILKAILQTPGLDKDFYKYMPALVTLCTIGQAGVGRILPTGAPTSPILANIAATPIDYELAHAALQHGFRYTRYIDDLTFSSDKTEEDPIFLNEVRRIVEENDYQLNGKKTQWVRPYSIRKFQVTGVTLQSERTTNKVPKAIRRICRARLDHLAYERADKLDSVTAGYLAYMKMVDPAQHSKFLDYYQRRQEKYRERTIGPCTSTE